MISTFMVWYLSYSPPWETLARFLDSNGWWMTLVLSILSAFVLPVYFLHFQIKKKKINHEKPPCKAKLNVNILKLRQNIFTCFVSFTDFCYTVYDKPLCLPWLLLHVGVFPYLYFLAPISYADLVHITDCWCERHSWIWTYLIQKSFCT